MGARAWLHTGFVSMSREAGLIGAARPDALALALSILALFACLIVSGVARADALDDTLAKFLDDKFPQSEKAIGELAAEAPPQAAAILDALGDSRLLIDAADHIVAYKTATGTIF